MGRQLLGAVSVLVLILVLAPAAAGALEEEVFVANLSVSSITVYARTANGDAVPVRTIQGPATGLVNPAALFLDRGRNELYVANDECDGSDSITVYAATASGNVLPLRTVQGAATGLVCPLGVAVDLSHDELIVANRFAPSVTVYSRTASGDIAPVRTIQGASTGLEPGGPGGIAYDPVHDEIVAAVQSPPRIVVHARTATGDVAPLRTIAGAATMLSDLRSVFVDLGRDEIVAADGNSDRVLVFGRTANGNVAPLRTVQVGGPVGTAQPSGVFADRAHDELLVVNRVGGTTGTGTVQALDRTATGYPPPLRSIEGPSTGLQGPFALVVTPVGAELVVSNSGTRVAAFERNATGDAAPLRALEGAATGLFGSSGVVVDRVHGELVVAKFEGSVRTYPLLAEGNVAPLRVLEGPGTGLSGPIGVAVDLVHDELITTNYNGQSITVHSRAASGNAAPLRTVQGFSITLPYGVAVDPLHDEIVVTVAGQVLVYARTATGDATPVRTIAGPATGIDAPGGVVVDLVHDEILVANGAGSITVYPRTANGNVAPIRTIQGGAAGLAGPIGLLLDLVRDEIFVVNHVTSSVTVYARAATGNVAPLRVLGGTLTGMNDPRFLALLEPPVLQVVRPAPGTGTVTSSPPGISCPPDCVEAYAPGTVVTLTATPGPGLAFTGWAGACTGSADCAVALGFTRAVAATFSPLAPGLTLTVVGDGVVTSSPPGLSCPFDCAESFPSGTVVQLTATAGGGAVLQGLTGAPDCGDGVVTLTAAVACTVIFVAPPVAVVGLVSPGLGGQAANGLSLHPSVSDDGQRVVFESSATNLVSSGCTTDLVPLQIFLRLRGLPTTEGGARCLSVSPSGAPGAGESHHPRISGDGTVVVFDTTAPNLVGGAAAARSRAPASSCAAGVAQVVVRLLGPGVTECVSVGPDGSPGNGPSVQPVVSRDGRYVAFLSSATNLAAPCTTGVPQVFRRDRVTGTTSCVSVGAGGPGAAASFAPALSADGAVVAFASLAGNLAAPCATGLSQIFLAQGGTLSCVSLGPGGGPGNGDSRAPSLSADGQRVAFEADATNLAAPCATGVTQVYLLDRALGLLGCASVGPSGVLGDGPSTEPSLSGDGGILTFTSAATNLVGGASAGPRAAAGQTHIGPASVSTGSVQTAWQALLGAAAGGGGGGGGGASSSSQAQTTAGGQTTVATTPEGVMVVQQVPPPPSGRALVVEPAPLTEYPLGLPVPLPLRLRWTGVQNADHYRLEAVGPDQPFATAANGQAFDHATLADEVPAPEYLVADLAALTPPPGRYRVRVIGLDPGGSPGSSTFSDDLVLLLRPVASAPVLGEGRPHLLVPAAGATAARGQLLTFVWTPLAGVTDYGFEFTAPDCPFTTTLVTQLGLDPCGFLGAGGGLLVEGPTLTVTVPANFAPGAYQVRVVGASLAPLAPVGLLSDPLTVHLE